MYSILLIIYMIMMEIINYSDYDAINIILFKLVN